jgi:predicted kinase
MEKIELDVPTLILGAGISGSGKTVIMTEVARNVLNSVYISKDTINESFLATVNPSSKGNHIYNLDGQPILRNSDYYSRNVKFQSYHCMMELAKDNLVLGKHPIVEGNYTKEIQNGYIDEILNPFFISVPHRTKLIFCHADEENIRKRLQDRNSLRDAEKLKSEESWQAFLKSQPILPVELERYDHVKVDTTEPIEMNIEEILDYLRR